MHPVCLLRRGRSLESQQNSEKNDHHTSGNLPTSLIYQRTSTVSTVRTKIIVSYPVRRFSSVGRTKLGRLDVTVGSCKTTVKCFRFGTIAQGSSISSDIINGNFTLATVHADPIFSRAHIHFILTRQTDISIRTHAAFIVGIVQLSKQTAMKTKLC